jgi:hypothetical protein
VWGELIELIRHATDRNCYMTQAEWTNKQSEPGCQCDECSLNVGKTNYMKEFKLKNNNIVLDGVSCAWKEILHFRG